MSTGLFEMIRSLMLGVALGLAIASYIITFDLDDRIEVLESLVEQGEDIK